MSLIDARLVVLRQHLVFSANRSLQKYYKFFLLLSRFFIGSTGDSGSVFLIVSCNSSCWPVVQLWKDSMSTVQFWYPYYLFIKLFSLCCIIHEDLSFLRRSPWQVCCGTIPSTHSKYCLCGSCACTSLQIVNPLNEFRETQCEVCGNKMPTRCNRGFYCRSYCLLNMFRAPLCPSSGA